MNPLERGRNLLNQVRTGAGQTINRAQNAVGNAVEGARNVAGNVVEGARNVAGNVVEGTRNVAGNVVEGTRNVAGNVVEGARNVANETGRRIGQAVDGFEDRAVQAGRSVQEMFGGGNQPDRAFDGQFLGANGRTFPPGTALADVPGVTPRNNPNPSTTVLYVNGIQTPLAAQANSLQAIADTTGARVVGIHNSTEGFAADLAQCVKDKLDMGTNPAVDTLANTLYTEIKAGRNVHLMAHSQGGLISSRALNDVYNRLRVEDGMSQSQAQQAMSRINVETFGAAAMRYPDGPNYVHYVNRGDPVPGMFGLGPVADRWNPAVDGGRGSVVHHFNDFKLNPIAAHGFESIYLQHRVPFDQARTGNFNR